MFAYLSVSVDQTSMTIQHIYAYFTTKGESQHFKLGGIILLHIVI